MMSLNRFFVAVVACLCPLTASAGVMLTANVYDTPGLPGYQTFDLTASASTGYLNGFDFTQSGLGGVSGPLHQGGAPSEDPWASYGADTLFGGLSGDVADSHWLVHSNDGFAVQSSQSDSDLGAAFVFSRTSGLRGSYRNLPFARIVTNDPSAVSLDGEFLVEQYWSDGGGAGDELFTVSSLLSDISTGPAPDYTTFPDRPLPPFMQPPKVTPPVVDPPPTTPVPDEPTPIEPVDPVVLPVEPPNYVPRTVTVEDYQKQLTDRQADLQRQIDALKAEQAKVDGLLVESQEPGFVPPTNIITIQPYPTRWPTYTTYPWFGSVATIDVVRTATPVFELSDFVIDSSVIFDGIEITAAAYDFEATTLESTFSVASSLDIIPEPSTFLMVLTAVVATRLRRR